MIKKHTPGDIPSISETPEYKQAAKILRENKYISIAGAIVLIVSAYYFGRLILQLD